MYPKKSLSCFRGPGGGLVTSQISSPKDLFSFSHSRNTMRLDTDRIGALKTISTSPKGMRATVDEQIDAWKSKQKEDPERKAGVGKHTRIGIGLPMSNIFATYVQAVESRSEY